MMMYPGIYIHIPFCFKKCSYCDFYSVGGNKELHSTFISSLLQEITEKSHVHAGKRFDTVYIGGGTPNVLSGDHISSIITHIKKSYSLLEDTEITLEINPEFVSEETLLHYKSMGINRFSVGCQSFTDSELRFLNRIHNSSKNHEILKLLRQNDVSNISCDLIVGLPNQSLQNIEYNFEQLLTYRPEHLSVYTLSIEKDTPLYRDVESGFLSSPDPEIVREIYLAAHRLLTSAGYHHYEVSNYCLPGFESRHNIKYWNDCDYLGFGPSAHSKSGNKRSWNSNDLQSYIKGNREVEEEILSDKEQIDEKIMLSLRTSRGLDVSELTHGGRKMNSQAILDDINREGGNTLIIMDDNKIKITPHGWVVLDTIIEKLSEIMVG
jgi:oxygen-independent coproporphyrinogen-3 oxidase